MKRSFEDIMNMVAEGDGSVSFISFGDEDELGDSNEVREDMPILALKNTVLFPGIVIPITVGRDKSLNAIKAANEGDKMIGVVSQKHDDTEDPTPDELYKVGTVARILKILKMPDGTLTAVLQGVQRFALANVTQTEPFISGTVLFMRYDKGYADIEFSATISNIRESSKRIISLAPNIPKEADVVLGNIENDVFLLDFIASNLDLAVEKKQELLKLHDLKEKANRIHKEITKELHMLEVRNQIENRVRGDMEQHQRNYFLHQQLKTIQDELGENPQDEKLNELKARAQEKKWPEAVAKSFDKDLDRFERMNPQVAEYSMMLNYLETMLDLPWNEYTEDNYDLAKAKNILDKDHYGLTKVKKRILEHLAVLKLRQDMKAPILCLVGPPGVGKTSLGKSIAKALDREYVRMSLGGLHDESEIRGHRRTYIGAMPGRVIKSIKKAGSSNPVFILDEIDKVGTSFRGDPSSALLEVLDPEQNTTFHDNYLEQDYDLSKVLFIATANSLGTIQPALLDRMEIIEVSGYSVEEKIEIARKHLIPKQRADHGLKAKDIRLSEAAIEKIISEYTRESGVRNLDRQLAGVMRAVAAWIAMEEPYKKTINPAKIEEILGPQPFSLRQYEEPSSAGVAVGLAWTRVGGDILYIETKLSKGKGKMVLTGNLGDVMKESAHTAYSFVRSHADVLDIDEEAFSTHDVHIHVPAGATPKDGPSAGITMMSSIASAFSGKKVKPYLAMTGEITLRGKVLPVGGIKEKILAARRAGMTSVMLSSQNRRHIEEIDQDHLGELQIIYVDSMREVLQQAVGIWDFG